MARCPDLEYRDGKFYCKITGQVYDFDSSKVKFTCKPEYGEEYKNCPAYKSK